MATTWKEGINKIYINMASYAGDDICYVPPILTGTDGIH